MSQELNQEQIALKSEFNAFRHEVEAKLDQQIAILRQLQQQGRLDGPNGWSLSWKESLAYGGFVARS